MSTFGEVRDALQSILEEATLDEHGDDLTAVKERFATFLACGAICGDGFIIFF